MKQMTELEQLTNKINELESKITELENKNHINEKVVCDICNKKFKNKYILRTHMQNIHCENRQSYTCEICGKQLKSKYYLQYHISHLHNNNDKQ